MYFRHIETILAWDRGAVSVVNMIARAEPVCAAPRAGADLRTARERLGWELPKAAAKLRIRLAYLEALEEGDFSRLPGNAFALGFLRCYTTALGLDPVEMLRRFKDEAAEVSQKTELVFLAPVPERGLPMGAVILVGLVLAVGAYIGWYKLSGEGRLPAETTTAIPERLASLAEQALPLAMGPLAMGPSAIGRSGGGAVRTDAVPEPMEPPYVAPTVSPSSAAAAPVMPPPPVLAVVVTPPSADQSRIVLRATAKAWMEVRERGSVILNRVFDAGETWPVPPRLGLTLTTGNAGGTEIVVDGVAAPSLGATGVLRDLPLDADRIKDGKLAPSAMRLAP